MAHFGHKKAKKVAQNFNMVFVQLYHGLTSCQKTLAECLEMPYNVVYRCLGRCCYDFSYRSF